MNRKTFLYIFLIAIIITGSDLYSIAPDFPETLPVNNGQQDTTKGNQILYNGKMWKNLYSKVKGDQFLFSKDLLPGSLTINSKTYKNIGISYDIFKDEIIIITNLGTLLQVNKEMVDRFAMVFGNKTYCFINTQEDSVTGIKGYVNVLYKGKSALYVKYRKEIDLLAVDNKYDSFSETFRIYFLKNGIVYPVTGKVKFLKILAENKIQIKDFIKKNRLRISKDNPESFIPVIRYYDSISQ